MLTSRRTRAREQEEAERAESARRVRDTLAAAINDAIVHTVGARQALVRGAHPDDVLSRLQAAEDSAREALSDLEQLTAVITAPPEA